MKKLLFLTGTRADFGKMKPLMQSVDEHPDFFCDVFITGMHTLGKYGFTANEVKKAGFKHTYTYINQYAGDPMDMILASTISGLSRYINESSPDMLIIHGDRVEALAGAIVGALKNVQVCHIEGGERSGTIDDSIRHAVSKLAHLHCVSNDEAKLRLIQMGEDPSQIHIIGSPDIDAMLSNRLPSLEKVKLHYEIPFEEYGILLYHPVTTDLENMPTHAKKVVDSIITSEKNFVVIFPNNDEGSEFILQEYKRLKALENVRLFPSIKFEAFLTLIKHACCMVGNSSAGIRETPFYGIPSVNIGNRQQARYFSESISHVETKEKAITEAIRAAFDKPKYAKDNYFGDGNSTSLFMNVLNMQSTWEQDIQKTFNDINLTSHLSS